MSNFTTAYKTVRANEGGYRNVSWDAGGETYKGISRVANPSWSGWKIIDEYKKTHTLKTGDVINNPELDRLVQSLFEINYWSKNNLGSIANQSLATLCFDMVVQHGRGPLLINEAANRIRTVPTSSTLTSATIAVLNLYPQLSYKEIVDRRIAYVESLKTNLGADYAGVLARAKSFLTRYSAEIAGGTAIVVAAVFFF